MKTPLIIGALVAALFSLPAIAQTPPEKGAQAGTEKSMPGMGMQQGQRSPVDCSKAKDAEQCKGRQEAHRKARDACKDKAGPERKTCMHEQAQNSDCGKARNPQQCESRKQAYASCKEQSGPQFKRCVQEKMPPVDCSKSADAARCDRHQKIREMCKDKIGSEHKQCLRDNLAPQK